MYQRNFTPLFAVFAIIVLLVIMFLGSRTYEPQYRLTSASPLPATTAKTPISLDPLVTPGPGAQ